MELGMLIQQKRRQAGMTIDALSEKSGVPKGTLNKIINGITRDPQLETVKALAHALAARWRTLTTHPGPAPCPSRNWNWFRNTGGWTVTAASWWSWSSTRNWPGPKTDI